MINEIRHKQFNRNHYEILIRCAEKGDLNGWNEWRQNKKGLQILLEGAELGGLNLQGADLSEVDLADAELWKTNLSSAGIEMSRISGN